MISTTFSKILGRSGYRVNREIIENVLQKMGYSISLTPFGISAKKKDKIGRYHFEIELHPDGEIHNNSEIGFHKDLGIRLFHGVALGGEEVCKEFTRFHKELMKKLANEMHHEQSHRIEINRE